MHSKKFVHPRCCATGRSGTGVFFQQHSCKIILSTKAAFGVSIWWAHVIAHISAHWHIQHYIFKSNGKSVTVIYWVMLILSTSLWAEDWQKDWSQVDIREQANFKNGYWCNWIWKSSNGQNSFRVAFWMFLLSETRLCLLYPNDIKLLPLSTQSKIYCNVVWNSWTNHIAISKMTTSACKLKELCMASDVECLETAPYRRQNEKIAQIDANGYQPSTI